jgi:hypothetical protein
LFTNGLLTNSASFGEPLEAWEIDLASRRYLHKKQIITIIQQGAERRTSQIHGHFEYAIDECHIGNITRQQRLEKGLLAPALR